MMDSITIWKDATITQGDLAGQVGKVVGADWTKQQVEIEIADGIIVTVPWDSVQQKEGDAGEGRGTGIKVHINGKEVEPGVNQFPRRLPAQKIYEIGNIAPKAPWTHPKVSMDLAPSMTYRFVKDYYETFLRYHAEGKDIPHDDLLNLYAHANTIIGTVAGKIPNGAPLAKPSRIITAPLKHEPAEAFPGANCQTCGDTGFFLDADLKDWPCLNRCPMDVEAYVKLIKDVEGIEVDVIRLQRWAEAWTDTCADGKCPLSYQPGGCKRCGSKANDA